MTCFWAKTTSDGKPGISVFDHMRNVGSVARFIANLTPNLLDRFQLQSSLVAALVALHDLGKISPGFQQKCEAWLEENGLSKIAKNGVWDTAMEDDHGKVSHAAIQSFLLKLGCDRDSAKFVSTILGAHHGRLTPPSDRGYLPPKLISDTASKIAWDAERTKNANMILDHFDAHAAACVLTDDSPALWWLAGLTSVADWIGSDERFFPPEPTALAGDAATRARTALDSIGFLPLVVNRGLSFKQVFSFSPNDMQEKALAAITGPGVYVIEAPMGMGKTEAALGAAYQLMVDGKANGIYFALPTQATSNRIHLRMNDFLRRIAPGGDQSSRLIHSNSWLMHADCGIHPSSTVKQEIPADDARAGRDWFASTKRALIAPFGVGTIDQALLGIVAAKHFFVRHFALAGKVVILDEVHSYDLYTGTLIDKLIATLEGLGCTVIVLSATLTGKRRGQIVSHPGENSDAAMLSYPLISGRKENVSFVPIAAQPPESRAVKVDFLSSTDATEEAINLAQKGGSILWICNTVGAAQKQYKRVTQLVQGAFPVGLIHSRFPFWSREHLEDKWMAHFGKDGTNRSASILISTQVVEQSVDLDADLLITELAPTDMLLQRLGRLWRHERENRPIDNPRICIIEEDETLERLIQLEPKAIVKALGKKAKVYAPYVLLRSLEVWKAQPGKVTIPSQIRNLIEATYSDRWEYEHESWQKLFADWFGTDSAKAMIASRNSNIWQLALEDKEGVQTRLNEMLTLSIVLCKSIDKKGVIFLDGTYVKLGGDTFQFDAAQAINKNLVKVPDYCFNSIKACSAFTDYLSGAQSVGIVTDGGIVEIEGLKSGIRLVYFDEVGLVIEQAS